MPGLVPIMVGATSADKEKEYGRFFAPYLANAENLFIVSSDFCHWYSRLLNRLNSGVLDSHLRTIINRIVVWHIQLHEQLIPVRQYTKPLRLSTKKAWLSSKAVTTTHSQPTSVKQATPSVDGLPLPWRPLIRSHPIGVVMCALTELEKTGVKGKWEFIKYEQSSHVESVSDSSVSYVSAYWAPTQ